MNPNNQLWAPVTPAQLEWREDGVPRSLQYGDLYYSAENGLEESRHVFLAGSGIPERWTDHDQDAFCIGETGFGSGLNFLACWQAWRHQRVGKHWPRLHYIAVEKHPLAARDLQQALTGWRELEALSSQLIDEYPILVPGQHRLVFDGGQVVLDLHLGDVADVLVDFCNSASPAIDAWFLDGFAPRSNPQMWDEDLFHAIARASRPGATIATFSCAGAVRQGLAAAGFDVIKAPGYGHKREQLVGQLNRRPKSDQLYHTPWHLPDSISPPVTEAIVLGAGLAGCTTAAALAGKGMRVTVLDCDAVAGAASGNAQGVLYTRLSSKRSTLVDFALQSFEFARRYYRSLLQSGSLKSGIDGDLCGSFQQNAPGVEMEYLAGVLSKVPDLASVVNEAAAEELLRVEGTGPGYWFPQSGWISPPALCRQLIDRPGITLREHCGDISLAAGDTGWQVCGSGNALLAQARVAVICCGHRSQSLPWLNWLPLRSIRGQVTELSADQSLTELRAVFCHEGYITPAGPSGQCLGATFDIDDPEEQVRMEDHRRNLSSLSEALPGVDISVAGLNIPELKGKVGFRCASPDYLPIVGPVPKYESFLERYNGLGKNARKVIPQRAPHLPGLYVNTAHGSRGLSSTPLCAQIIASEVCGELVPLSSRLHRALSPARFLVRDLVRGRL